MNTSTPRIRSSRPAVGPPPRRRRAVLLLALPLLAVLPRPAAGQNFVAVTDSTNPINTTPPSGNYTGAAWADMDNDGWPDLFMARKRPVFRNAGGGVFEKMTGAINDQGNAIGTSWSDYDNDGDIDCFTVGGVFSTRGGSLYRNDGGFVFNEVNADGTSDPSFNTGWGCAWGDMDNDGYTDLVIAAANMFAGVTHENRLLHNNGDGTLAQDFTTAVTESLDAYTIPMWSDYDQDGDMDIFIGSGEVSVLSPDNLFRNTLVENGTWGFERITTAPIATDSVNGQNWNWIDYDNDGDLDGYQTNYGSVPNNLYRNDAGTYVRMTVPDVGSIVSNLGSSLGNVWGDFDNDGDLDCIVTNDGSSFMDYFRNDGGVFAQVTGTAFTTEAGPHYGSPIADYDRDGDLDIYIHGNSSTRKLWENQLANGNSWINIKLVGAGAPLSNVSAIGARVRAKASVFGTPTWQLREVTAENGFNSMNSLNVHFGFGDATVIDSLVIEWPSGGVDMMTSVPVEQFLTVNEAMAPSGVNGPLANAATGSLGLARPNPFATSTEIAFELAKASHVTLDVIDVTGRRVRTLLDEPGAPGVHRAVWDGRDADGRTVASGVYLMRMTTAPEGGGAREVRTRRMIRMR